MGAIADGILNVPWIVFDHDYRRQIEQGCSVDIEAEQSRDVEQNLKELGYLS